MDKQLNFHIISISTYGTGLSGGDRIFIELSKRLNKKYPISIYLWEEGLKICNREGLKNVKYVIWPASFFAKFGFFVNYFARVLISIYFCLRLRLENSPSTIVYSASEFWQDSFGAFILKLKFSKIKWIAAWYQTAPNPFLGFAEGGGKKLLPDLRALAYWFVQLPVKPIIKQFADTVFVTSEPDKLQFPKLNSQKNVVVIRGGVDLSATHTYLKRKKQIKKIYDAVFQGRFHPQKGVTELIDIWKLVVEKFPKAKLAMIGDGPVMNKVKLQIANYKLQNNIKLFGYLFDGHEKYKVFSQSKMVLHPAVYDSGGMAAAEAMSFGMPGVSYDLKSLKSYYPKGMVKVPIGNKKKFASSIIKLLDNSDYYKVYKQEAIDLIKQAWSWDSLAKKLELELFSR